MIPDPVPELEPDPEFDLRIMFGIPDNQKIFLHIGSLLKRKGTLDILKAMSLLTQEERSRFVLVILGVAEKQMDRRISNVIPAEAGTPSPDEGDPGVRRDDKGARDPGMRQDDSRGGIHYQNTFLTQSRFKAAIDQCDLVLVPYRYTESSSGVVGHAIAAGKPMLGVRQGLLGETIREHGSGILIDEPGPKAIAEGVRKALVTEPVGKTSLRYIQSHTKKTFAQGIIMAILR